MYKNSKIDLAFAGHSKHIKMFLNADQTEDFMEAIQDLVNEVIRKVRQPANPPRALTITVPNPAYQQGQRTYQREQGVGMMELQGQKWLQCMALLEKDIYPSTNGSR